MPPVFSRGLVGGAVFGRLRKGAGDSGLPLPVGDDKGHRLRRLDGKAHLHRHPAGLPPAGEGQLPQDPRGGGDVLLAPPAEHLHPPAAGEVPVGKTAAGKDRPEGVHVKGPAVQGRPAGGGGGGHVFGALHPPFNLQVDDPCFLQLRHPGDEGEVLQGKGVLPPLGGAEIQAAGLGAPAPVAAALP